MKLLHLSIVTIILCALGMVILLAVTLTSVKQLHDREQEIADLFSLQEEIDDFSVASDGLLLFESDPNLWRAFVADARAIQSRLGQYATEFPDALKASHRIDVIINTLDSVRSQDVTSGDHVVGGPLNLSPRSTHILNKVATDGVALDTALDDMFVERQHSVAQAERRIIITLSIATMVFGALCVVAFSLIYRRISLPARSFIQTVERLQQGDMTARAKVNGTDELAELAIAFNRMLDQRETQQSELETNEQMLSESQRIVSLGSWRLNLFTDKLVWSEETYRIVGVSPQDFTPSDDAFFALVHPDDMSKLTAMRSSSLEGKNLHDVVFRIIRPDGQIRHLHERGQVFFDDDNNALTFAGTVQDITERKQLDDRLLQYSQLVESTNDICFIYDNEYRILYVNLAYADFLHMSRQEIEGKFVPDLLGEDLFRTEIEPHLRAALAGERRHYESTRENPKSGTRYVLVNYFPISTQNQNNYVGGVITDITRLKLAEQELKQQSHLLDIGGRVARLGGWSVNLVSGEITWSDVVCEIHDRPHGYKPTLEEAINYYSEQDREKIASLFNRCVELGHSYDDIFQIVTARGRRVWVRTAGEPVYNDLEEVTMVRGAFQDVSERQDFINQLEQRASELHIANEEINKTLTLRQSLINSLPAHIALLDESGTIIDVNEQWRHFGKENAFQGDDFGLGINYVRLCENSSGDCAEEALDVAGGLRSVLAGKSESYTLEYPCHAPHEERWFRVTANSIATDSDTGKSLGLVVMHIDITARKQAEVTLRRLAYEDILTGLWSRNGFIKTLEDYFDENGWEDGGMLFHLDIVNMHDINQAHGYAAGDELFRQIGARLQAGIGERAFVARPGSDEFAVYLPATENTSLALVHDQFDALFSRTFDVSGVKTHILVRIGFTTLGNERRNIDTLLREAELAVFHSRNEGAGIRWSCFNEEIGDATAQRMMITRELHHALKNDEFELHFQPKVDLADGSVIACEALIRWEHPERGMLSPGIFIPIAEQSQLIEPIGDWVMNEACRYLRKWMDEGLDTIRVSVNVSMTQVIADDFLDKVNAALTQHRIIPENLTLEITESVFDNHTNKLKTKLNQLNKMGIRTSLDDFGTGYSSLRYLQEFHFDEIKIDQGFVFKMLHDSYSYSIVEAIFVISSALGAEVVAEGIEEAGVADALKGLGCRVGQGYYFSPPLPAEDFHWLIKQHRQLPLSKE